MSGKEVMRMNEMRAYHETAGQIEVYTNPGGRILITCMPIVEEKEGPIYKAVNALGTLISGCACLGMVFLVAKVAGLV